MRGSVRVLRRGATLLLLGALGCLGPGDRADLPVDRPSPYQRAVSHRAPRVESHYVPMRDGVRLAVDLVLPEGLDASDRRPALLYQGRYWRNVELRRPARWFFGGVRSQARIGAFKDYFVRHGYVWVDVDTRGSGASFGLRTWEYSPAEIQDGPELVDWIVRQPWSDGRVAAIGVSYSGGAAEFLATRRHPALRAVAPLFCEFDQYRHIVAPGGVPHRAWLRSWGAFTRSLDRGVLPEEFGIARWFVRGVAPVDGDHAALAAAQQEHEESFAFASLERVVDRDDVPVRLEDARTPAQRGALEDAWAWLAERFGPDFLSLGTDLASTHAYLGELQEAALPTYAYSGWYDGAYAAAAIERFLAVPDPRSRLTLGPWDHALQYTSPHRRARPSRFDHAGELLRFVDQHVLGRDTGLDREARVHYYTLGAEAWRAAESWPPPHRKRRLYLASDGQLRDQPAAAPDEALYRVDFQAATGAASRWGALTGRPIGAPYPDRARRDHRLLVYDSEPLGRSLEVTGHPRVELTLASSREDGAFHAYLEDVAPDGRVHYVSEGLLRGRHRATAPASSTDPALRDRPRRSFRRADARPLVPGEPTELIFELYPISYRFGAGHRIRLALAGADADHFARIPASGDVEWRVHHGGAGASQLLLPTVDR